MGSRATATRRGAQELRLPGTRRPAHEDMRADAAQVDREDAVRSAPDDRGRCRGDRRRAHGIRPPPRSAPRHPSWLTRAPHRGPPRRAPSRARSPTRRGLGAAERRERSSQAFGPPPPTRSGTIGTGGRAADSRRVRRPVAVSRTEPQPPGRRPGPVRRRPRTSPLARAAVTTSLGGPVARGGTTRTRAGGDDERADGIGDGPGGRPGGGAIETTTTRRTRGDGHGEPRRRVSGAAGPRPSAARRRSRRKAPRRRGIHVPERRGDRVPSRGVGAGPVLGPGRPASWLADAQPHDETVVARSRGPASGRSTVVRFACGSG